MIQLTTNIRSDEIYELRMEFRPNYPVGIFNRIYVSEKIYSKLEIDYMNTDLKDLWKNNINDLLLVIPSDKRDQFLKELKFYI